MHVWNTEEMSEFYIDLRIISIKLVCKSLIMNELPWVLMKAEKLPHLAVRKWNARQRRMQRNGQRSWKIVPVSNITEDKERKDLRRCDPLPMTGSKLTMGMAEQRLLLLFPRAHVCSVMEKKKSMRERENGSWRSPRCVCKMCSRNPIVKRSWKRVGDVGGNFVLRGSY